MYKHILIPTDGSSLSDMAVVQGIALAKSLGAKVTSLTVTPTFHTFAVEPMMIADTPTQYENDSAAWAAKCLGAVAAVAAAAGVQCKTVHAVHDRPYESIIDTAKREGCDLIFMASHGRKGVSALVLGSETTKVLTHGKTPVLVCR